MIAILGAVVAVILVVVYLFASLQIVQQWEELLIFTFGRYTGSRGPGIRLVFAVVQKGVKVDKRIRTTEFRTDGTLSRDKVSVTLLAVLFWRVRDVKKATIDVRDYQGTIDLAAQTTLRDLVSRSDLEQLLSDQRRLDEQIASQIRERAESWGVEVQNVEIRDLVIPSSLQEVLSRKAQAQAEKDARRIYGEAEVVAAEEFLKAAHLYETSPVAFRLRGLTVLLEAIKSDNNTLLFLPTELTSVLRGLESEAAPGKNP